MDKYREPQQFELTEQYLGCMQKLRYAINDKVGIELRLIKLHARAGNPPLGD
jgi:hypothetical protein